MKKIYLLLFFCILCVCPGCGKIEEFFVEMEAADWVDQNLQLRASVLSLLFPQAADLMPECNKVKITQKISEGKWKAVIYYSNVGKENCIVYYDENGEVCVSFISKEKTEE